MPTSIDPIDYKNTILSGIASQPVGAPRDYSAAYGGIPTLPAYTQDVSTILGADKQAQMIANLPNYQAMVGADVANITSNLGGQVPADVVNQLATRAAERGIQMGSPGAPNTNAAYLRALGLTSMQLQQLGNQQLTQAMQRTPMQEMQTTSAVKDLGLERAQYAAAPSPQAAAQQALANAMRGIKQGNQGVRAPSSVSMPNTWARNKANEDLLREVANPEEARRMISAQEARWAENERARAWAASQAPQWGTSNPWGVAPSTSGAVPIPGLMSSDYYRIPGGGGIRDMNFGITDYEPTPSYGYTPNQPTSRGSMYVSPQSEWTQQSPVSYEDYASSGFYV